jgi:Zn finger protein HypA/HybF involved in hydrogenase expression
VFIRGGFPFSIGNPTFDNLMKESSRKLTKLLLVIVFAFFLAMRFGDIGAQGQRQGQPSGRWGMSAQEALGRSAGCMDCHQGIEDMHNGAVRLGCTDCHGGDASIRLAAEAIKGSPNYEAAKQRAHIQPRYPDRWKSSANPERSYAQLNRESPEFIRFVNPGDLRVANKSCGTSECHPRDAHNVNRSMMKTGAMLWGAALYNNGSFPLKNYRFGESYSSDGFPERIEADRPPSLEETLRKGVLPFLYPLPRWEITQPGNILRAFERGGRKAPEVGMPAPDEVPGRPTQNLLSSRGVGTNSRTDPVFLGLQKTRLLDPMLSFLGTNDQPGDYRSSGCTACHVVYANDRDPFHSGPYAQYGHNGFSHSGDPTIPKNESGHPIKHQFTRAIPSSQCVVCHMHPGTLTLNTYYGTTWWDLETDGAQMYPAASKKLSPEETRRIQERNPEGSALKGLWGDPEFLENLSQVNGKLKHTQFADFNGHGWIYRAVFKQDRKGNLLDLNGDVVQDVTSEKLQQAVKETTEGTARDGVPVHLKDIHLEKGMHCVDCHFRQDSHGNGKLYGEARNAIEIDCIDCHGTINRRADPTSKEARTSAAAGGAQMLDYRKVFPLDNQNQSPQFSQDRFFKKDGKLFQRSAVEQGKVWEVVQVMDSITPGNSHYNEKARLAKTILKDGKTWGAAPADESKLAHANSRMTCYTCHLSWTPSCFGCHLKQQANQKRPMLHNEGEADLRNWTSYNFQTLRDDVFMLGRDGAVTGRRFAPVRSACAVVVSSQNANREWIYSQQQTISAEGYSGIAFSSHFPHTVRTKETKACVDCHLSADNDNNAYLAMALMQGTNFYNFIGRYAYVAQGSAGFEAVAVTERDEPQAVIGSELHRLAYPESYAKHQQRGQMLEEASHHPGNDIGAGLLSLGNPSQEVLSLQLRGEYLYAATGKGGIRIFDVANIDQKGFSERITSAPVSALGQRLYVKSKYATAIASPSTLAIDPTRNHRPENQEAQNRDDKQPIHPLYAFLYATDRYEGLIVVGDPKMGVATLLDGNPSNNFLKRALTWNPDGILNGANNITIAGTHAYITCDRGLVILDIDNPLKPRIAGVIGQPQIKSPRAVQVQFRYAFVCDAEGVKVVDVTNPDQPKAINGATVALAEANNIYLVRTYAYVAAGKQGLAILDIERPEQPRIDQIYNANGAINDARDAKVGMTNVSLFAYVADGVNGLRVIQLTSPEWTPGNYGFSPRPAPKLIATHRTRGPALAVSEGLDRDRAVDESGNQLSVFGRRGARPFNLEETRRMYSLQNGELFRVPKIKTVDDIRAFFGKPVDGEIVRSRLIGVGLLLFPLGISLLLWRKRQGK